jgi:hypothetical protein
MPHTPTPLPTPLILAVPPVVVAATAGLGAIFLNAFNLPLHRVEMLTAGAIAIIAGIISMIPIIAAARKKRPDALAIAALLAIGLRLVLMLIGTLLALGPGWSLSQFPLILWILAFYFPLLVAETTTITRMLKPQITDDGS